MCSLRIEKEINVDNLWYVWKSIDSHYNKYQFVSELCRNDILVREENEEDRELVAEGYRRNEWNSFVLLFNFIIDPMDEEEQQAHNSQPEIIEQEPPNQLN